MSARVISLVLAMVLAAAPMLATVCKWSCADGTHGSATVAGGHRHTDDATVRGHEMAGHTMSVAIALVPGCCDHADSQVVSIAAAKIAIEPPAITPTVFDVSDQLAVSVFTTVVTPVARPPVELSLLTPLRV
jgi:hypothetical protein